MIFLYGNCAKFILRQGVNFFLFNDFIMGNKKGRQNKYARKRSDEAEQRNLQKTVACYHQIKQGEGNVEEGSIEVEEVHMGERSGTLPIEVQIIEVREESESFPAESKTVDVGESSRSIPIEILVIEVREGSISGAGTGMGELLNIAQSVKYGISHKNLDHLLKMDVDKLRKLAASVQPLSLSKKRSMNKKIR